MYLILLIERHINKVYKYQPASQFASQFFVFGVVGRIWVGFACPSKNKNSPPRTGGTPNPKIKNSGKSKRKNAPNGAFLNWCRLSDLNQRPTDYKSAALPAELNRRCQTIIHISKTNASKKS